MVDADACPGHTDRVRRMILLNTICGGTAPAGTPTVADYPWKRWIDEGLESGRTQEVLSNLRSTILSVMKRIGFERTDVVDETWVRAYASAFPDVASCKGALQFPLGITAARTFEFLMEGASGFAASQKKPAILVGGTRDRAIPAPTAIAMFGSIWPDGPVIELTDAGHFVQEDAPEIVVPLIELLLQAT
jgi:haloalkane dehalogenase